MNVFIISLLAVSGTITAISAGCNKDGKDDALYLGKFGSANLMDENFNDVLKCMEYKEEDRETIRNSKFAIEFKKNSNNNTYSSIATFSNPPYYHNRVFNFVFGKETPETLCDGRVVKTTVTCRGPSMLTKEQKFEGPLTVRWIASFSADDVTVNVFCKDKSVILKHTRINQHNNA